MYSKDELKQLKREFWNGLDEYAAMLPQMRHRRHQKFMLYNTKVPGIEMKFDATRQEAQVILEFNHPQIDKRQEQYNHFVLCKSLLEKHLPQGLIWAEDYQRESGEQVSRIYLRQTGLDIHRREHWNAFYAFLAPNMIAMEQAFMEIKETLPD